MRVGVPTETKVDEYRVALTPAGARELAEHGHEVIVQDLAASEEVDRMVLLDLDQARAQAVADEYGGGNGKHVASYRDLGSFQLLLSLQDDDALRLFCDSVLGPLENGGGEYGDELLRSLEVFIEQNGQWERAARELFCHRHTLRYRIRRIEELTGRDLTSARDRIEFWLALRGRELVG